MEKGNSMDLMGKKLKESGKKENYNSILSHLIHHKTNILVDKANFEFCILYKFSFSFFIMYLINIKNKI